MNERNYDTLQLTRDHEFNLSDFALFLAVMKNKKAYQNVLSIILNEPELELLEVKAEEVILNKSGKRAIRLDTWATDSRSRQFNMEMQNDARQDNLAKRSRFYQGMLDTPILKSGRNTKYRQLPSTIIIFITQEDIFGKDKAMYTFKEKCLEEPDLFLDDGTQKIFLNMASRCGREDLVSLLQYMKQTSLDNPYVTSCDTRILELDQIVREVKESEEWEAVQMNILEIGLEEGRRLGIEIGIKEGLEEGLAKGLAAGREQGHAEGQAEGREQGIAHTNLLTRLLAKDGRMDDIIKAANDPDYQKKLFKEYNL